MCGCGGHQQQAATVPAQEKAPEPPEEAAVGIQQAFRLELPDGRSWAYGSHLEAEAARVRAGEGVVTRF